MHPNVRRAETRDGREASDPWRSLQISSISPASWLPTCSPSCILSKILHNPVLNAAQLFAVGLLWVPSCQLNRLRCWNFSSSQRAFSSHRFHTISPTLPCDCCWVRGGGYKTPAPRWVLPREVLWPGTFGDNNQLKSMAQVGL